MDKKGTKEGIVKWHAHGPLECTPRDVLEVQERKGDVILCLHLYLGPPIVSEPTNDLYRLHDHRTEVCFPLKTHNLLPLDEIGEHLLSVLGKRTKLVPLLPSWTLGSPPPLPS